MILDPEYAEIHYKFKLPWSFLYKKEPEILIDAPFEVAFGEPLRLFVIIRDANRFPVEIGTLAATFFKNGKNVGERKIAFDRSVKAPFAFFEADFGEFPAGDYEIRAHLKFHIGGRERILERFNLTGLSKTPLHVQVLQSPLPKPEGYLFGDTHAHTYFSADPVEFGASPAILQKAAASVGLDFVFCTDHSYDFAFAKDDYTKRDDANRRYAALREEITALPGYPRMIAGEEISAGNAEGKNVHLLFPGNLFYVEGEGDCGRKWLDNEPTLPIPEILSKTELPCFAAHPKEPMSRLERAIFRRGEWRAEDLHTNSRNPVAGLEFWNGSRDAGFEKGRRFWISELEKGNFLLPLGGNDAHGDLNEYTGVKIPLFKLKRSRAHVFGYVRTAIFGSDPLTAFRGRNLFVTDGPALWWTLDGERVLFHFKSSPDFGILRSLQIYAQKNSLEPDNEKETPIGVSLKKSSPFECSATVPLAPYAYVRAEAETETGRFALTSACPAIPDSART